MARRSKADAEKTRLDILRAATDVFTEYGFSETTVSKITARAGITKGALFHHFKTKEEVFEILWESLQSQMDAEARKAAYAARSRTDAYSAFLAGCRTYLKWAARPDYQQIVLIDGPSVLGLAGWYEADNDLGRRNVEAGIRYLARNKIVAEHRVPSLAIMVHNGLNGAGFALARGEQGITPDSILDAFETMLKSLH